MKVNMIRFGELMLTYLVILDDDMVVAVFATYDTFEVKSHF